MDHVLLTYDVSGAGEGFNTLLREVMVRDYHYTGHSPSGQYLLPANTLIKPNITPEQATLDLKQAVKTLEGEVLRYAACICEDYDFWSIG